ncbi:hypothetical protein ACHAW5_010757 [Stephanodiscus triporus]|uniref:Uncharacterized protein n=1 Tax=Stephanodiscus triporus TaxID=2934178 RepID=A0ABD3PST3_9STRA
MTYRFANEPESDEVDDEKERPRRRKMYGGKVRIRFRADGYSDILPSPTTTDDYDERIERIDGASFDKVWGWDLEDEASADSGDDDTTREYLLFAADVRLPPPISAVKKFYFQASVVIGDDHDGVLSLKDGSVTVKRDVGPPRGGGWWGVFRGGNGILARFVQVGEFRCRPIHDS